MDGNYWNFLKENERNYYSRDFLKNLDSLKKLEEHEVKYLSRFLGFVVFQNVQFWIIRENMFRILILMMVVKNPCRISAAGSLDETALCRRQITYVVASEDVAT